ncbi:fibronectin type III domain-containing protein, partial [Sporolactobacillus shoreicorticis]|uniref:Fibronectin type III domain-containing protein n=1 Tax=Sporolactobacillus shoreicorticis TaxID=1923877 RepID=A0ABW5S543_9BACL
MAIIDTVLTHIDDRMSENDHLYGHLSIRNDELQRLKDFLGSFSVPGKATVTVTAGDGVLHATAVLPEDDGGNPITAVKFFIKKASDGNWPTEPATTQTPTDLTYDFTGLTNGTEYSTAVVVVNEVGDSGMSDSAHGTPTAPAG